MNKLWYGISRKWSRLKSKSPQTRVFSESRFDNELKLWYLIYRWAVCLTWTTIILCSLLEIGSEEPQGLDSRWLIYLTHWGVVLGMTESLLGCIVVSRRWLMQKAVDFDPMSQELGFLERSYWVAYVINSTMAICVTIIYWCVVFKPKLQLVDPLNILLHICNSLLVLIDFVIVKIPFLWLSFWWCLVVALIYVIFSIIYFVAGGVDKLGNRYIYPILNWVHPEMTILVCLGVFVFLFVLHCLFCYVARLLERKFNKGKYTEKKSNVRMISVKRMDLIV